MIKMTRYHFEFLAKEIAPMINGVFIRNGSFNKTVREFARNPRFDLGKFDYVSTKSWEDANIQPDCDPDDVGVLEEDFIPNNQQTMERKNGIKSKAA
tara:strand:- start:376 stop:666 length:291 start_codon:yes stop_codon:yes gene_type:complete